MITAFLAATMSTSTSLIIQSCLVSLSAYGICKNRNGISTKTSYSFKH